MKQIWVEKLPSRSRNRPRNQNQYIKDEYSSRGHSLKPERTWFIG